MENITQEKGLVKIENSIFARVRRFLTNIFKKKNYKTVKAEENETKTINDFIECNELKIESNNINTKEELETAEYEGKEELEQKLMNYYASIKNNLTK